MNLVNSAFRFIVTLVVVIFAIIFFWIAYQNYFANPSTRDGQVAAYVVKIAPRVNGPITKVLVKNNQYVKKGDLLFEIDPEPYEIDLAMQQARLTSAKDNLHELELEAQRREKIPTAISVEALTHAKTKYRIARAEARLSKMQVAQAKLNLSYTKIYAPVSGYVTNLTIDVGTYLSAGTPVLALIDKKSTWVYGYFKETMLNRIHKGDEAFVTLMAYPNKHLKGVVQSVGWGISRMDDKTASNLLPEVAATFDWVRLAQRIPVKIKLKDTPKSVKLFVGFTASVMIKPKKG